MTISRTSQIYKKLLLWLYAAVFVFALALPAHAETLMSLPQLPGYKAFTTNNQSDYKGQCGSATIAVGNANSIQEKYFTNLGVSNLVTPVMTITISNPARKGKVLTPRADQLNGVACVQTAKGKRILIWVNCGERICTPDFDHFYVIDPEKLAYVAPKEPENDECDRACAKRLVGGVAATAFLFVEPPRDDRQLVWPYYEGYRPFKTSDTHTFKGDCGPAKIIIQNVYDQASEPIYDERNQDVTWEQHSTFSMGDVEYIVYNPAQPGKVLFPLADDETSITCIQTPQGKKIKVWGNCNGSICSDKTEGGYEIDPKKMEMFYVDNDGKRLLCGQAANCSRYGSEPPKLPAALRASTFAPPAPAETLMSLPKLPGFKAFTTTNGREYTGQCGSASIVVTNVYGARRTDVTNITSGLNTDSISIKIFDPAKPKQVLKPPTNEELGIACLQTTQGKQILIWEKCAKNGCTQDYDDFYLIDSEKLTYIAPTDPKNQACDRQCLKPLVGDIEAIAFLFHSYTKDDWLMSLPAIQEHRQFKTKDGENYYGECGTAKIVAKKVYFNELDDSMDHQSDFARTFNNLNHFYAPNNAITEFEVTNPAHSGKILKPSPTDSNGIGCIQTAQGKRIALWGGLGDNEYSNHMDTRYVIDPENLAYMGNAGDDMCDGECARHILGNDFVDYVQHLPAVKDRDPVATAELARKLPAHTEPLMSLPKLLGYEEFATTDKINYFGQCGSAKIEVRGVFDLHTLNPPKAGNFWVYAFTNNKDEDDGRNFFKIYDPAKPDSVLNVEPVDDNTIACVPTPQGKRIMIRETCVATACDWRSRFYAIDPETLTFVAPKDPLDGICDAKCAKAIFGVPFIDYVEQDY